MPRLPSGASTGPQSRSSQSLPGISHIHAVWASKRSSIDLRTVMIAEVRCTARHAHVSPRLNLQRRVRACSRTNRDHTSYTRRSPLQRCPAIALSAILGQLASGPETIRRLHIRLTRDCCLRRFLHLRQREKAGSQKETVSFLGFPEHISFSHR